MLTLGALVVAAVMALLAAALLRSRRNRSDDDSPRNLDREDRRIDDWFVVGGGVIVPAVILVVLLVVTLRAMSALAEPDAADDAGRTPLVIEVVGHQWWWEARYPESGFVTANEIRIPVDRTIEVRAQTEDVIHSFWVPQLQGKIDMIPGHTNTIWLEADEPGVYRGQCAEFCGLQHALMDFRVIAEPPEAFAGWLALQQEEAVQPTSAEALVGQGLFSTRGCADCHTVRGTTFDGRVGPDLTHLMSRERIVAGLLPNNAGTLGGWVVDAQHIKPGNLMPSFGLTVEELRAILAYLTALE
jgi:cytochrome c oxidase subunit 2